MPKRKRKISPLLKQLLADLKSPPERLNVKVNIETVKNEDVREYCQRLGDIDVYRKMNSHELVHEPLEEIVVISQKNGQKIAKKDFDRILVDLGYNVNVLLSKDRGADYDAAISVGGYSIPGWKHLVNLLRKINSNIAIFLGKRFAPGMSRLHIRIYEGRKCQYVTAHIDKFGVLSFNIEGIKKAHFGSGGGDYKKGTKFFVNSLKYYFSNS